jgi:hypothetical protein
VEPKKLNLREKSSNQVKERRLICAELTKSKRDGVREVLPSVE